VTVAEVKALAPQAEVYELRPESRYLIVTDPAFVPRDMVRHLLAALGERGFQDVFVIQTHHGEGIQIFDLKGESK
jgi:hypothetical protein